MKMFIFTMISMISILALAAPETAERTINAADFQTCVFESNDVGKMKFRGSTREEAFERTARACLQARVQGYIKIRGDIPSAERKILFAEDCVNKTYCKH
ncbi:hypothetical protein K2X05_12910 [bacterium]|nr:hypothetical protein [bacterium]